MKTIRLNIFRLLATFLIFVVIILNYFSNELLFEHGSLQVIAFILPTLCMVILNNWLYIPVFFNKTKYFTYFFSLFTTILIAQIVTGYLTVFNFFNKQWFYLIYDFLRYFITAMAGFGILAYYQISVQQRQSFQKELIIKNTELSLLKKQLNPHFLFNNLNNIYYQCLGSADLAADLVAKLSSLMRYTLEYSMKDFTTIGQEIEIISNYISLEKARLPENASVVFESICEHPNLKILPLLLISYIENCFKHGTNMQQSHIDIKIKLIQSNNFIELECENRISEETKNIDSTGIGVKNTETRLKLLYPNNYEIKKEFNEKYYSIYLKINLKNES